MNNLQLDFFNNHSLESFTHYSYLSTGEGVYAYIILKENSGDDWDSLKSELRASVKTRITSFAMPDYIQVRVLRMSGSFSCLS